jgi:hypothetical protein
MPSSPKAALNPETPAAKRSSLKNAKGNFQPSKRANSTSNDKRGTGETVTISVDAVWTINNYDGIGNGVDQYTMYWGDGSSANGWPKRSKWVSFIDM